ncbi:MAG: DUF4282 domain-containing protein, partial [bacterium]
MEPGFLASLFDFSFSNFITSKLVKIIYALALLVICVSGVGIFFGGLSQGGVAGMA